MGLLKNFVGGWSDDPWVGFDVVVMVSVMGRARERGTALLVEDGDERWLGEQT